MNEIKCPHCGTYFPLDKSSYALIASQVRTQELELEVRSRVLQMEEQQRLLRQKEALQAEQDFRQRISDREKELEKRDAVIARLEEQLKSMAAVKQAELDLKLRDKDNEIIALKGQIAQGKEQTAVAVLTEKRNADLIIQKKDGEIASWKEKLDAVKSGSMHREQEIRQGYEQKLREKQEQVDYYKDLKTRLSTKMVGETLEVHCSTLFNTTIRPIMPQAYFEKDNDASGGTKGDFIFRDYDDGFEYVSIMFEMKNEQEQTAARHKNEDFLKKLDEDRRAKKCEYAVLVSMLEPDSELYNTGIVDMSHRYPKTYVIRPQFFIPIITLLVQASKKSVALQRELVIARSQSVDVANFEARLNDFKDRFSYNFRIASQHFHQAIDEIDKSIQHLQKIKEHLIGSENNLRLANNKADELTIRKLTYNNPTMKAKLEAAKIIAEQASLPDAHDVR